MRVDVWSDVVCPWCYIGKRNFEAALARFEHRDVVEVVWRSFELDPSAPALRELAYLDHLTLQRGHPVRVGEVDHRQPDPAVAAELVAWATDGWSEPPRRVLDPAHFEELERW